LKRTRRKRQAFFSLPSPSPRPCAKNSERRRFPRGSDLDGRSIKKKQWDVGREEVVRVGRFPDEEKVVAIIAVRGKGRSCISSTVWEVDEVLELRSRRAPSYAQQKGVTKKRHKPPLPGRVSRFGRPELGWLGGRYLNGNTCRNQDFTHTICRQCRQGIEVLCYV